MNILLALALAAAAQTSPSQAQKSKDLEALFLDMSKINLGTISNDDDDRKKYIYTIQLEKSRVMRKTLKGVYDNAFELYKKGEYDAAREMTGKILAIDPGYEDASILQRATIELKGSKRPFLSEKKLIEDKFEEGMALYRQGRLVEATARWEESVKLSPTNFKSRYWLRKARGELADEHFRRGQRAYRQHRLRETLDQWYAALVLNPRYPRLVSAIAKVEAEAREQDANEKLQAALNLYSQGLIDDALKMLDQVLEAGPGNAKAQKLQAEIRSEMASQHVAQGRQHYEGRRYDSAIASWKKAVTYGYEQKAADQLIARAKEQMRREEAAKKRAEELARQREEEAKKKKEEEERLAAEEKAKKEAEEQAAKANAGTTGQPVATTAPAATSEDNKRSSQQHYLSGVIFFQKGDYEKAKNEWSLALQLDPGNSDAQTGLKRIDSLYNGAQ